MRKIRSILRLTQQHQLLVLSFQFRGYFKEGVEHGRDDVVIQDCVIAVDRFKNCVYPVCGLTEYLCSEDAGYIQITRHLSSKREFAELHVLLDIVDVLFLNCGIAGKAVTLVHDAGVFGEVRID